MSDHCLSDFQPGSTAGLVRLQEKWEGNEGKQEPLQKKKKSYAPKTNWLLTPVSSAARKHLWEKNRFHLTFQLNHQSLHCHSAETSSTEMMQRPWPVEGQMSPQKASVFFLFIWEQLNLMSATALVMMKHRQWKPLSLGTMGSQWLTTLDYNIKSVKWHMCDTYIGKKSFTYMAARFLWALCFVQYSDASTYTLIS